MKRATTCLFLTLSFLTLVSWLFVPASFCEDLSSASYNLESWQVSGGWAFKETSTNYAVEESAIDWASRDALASTNYGVEGTIGYSQSLVPIINSVSPSNLSKHYTDESPSFTVSAQDPDSDAMEYQLKMDGTVKDSWQSSNVLTHALSTSDRGRHTYTVEVRDNSDGTTSRDQFAYVFRRPVK